MRHQTALTRELSYGLGDRAHHVQETTELSHRYFESYDLTGTIQSDLKRIEQNNDPLEVVTTKAGQAKLMAVFRRFILKYRPKVVLSFGGSPGDSLKALSVIFGFKGVIIDPAPNNTNFITIPMAVTNDNITDIILSLPFEDTIAFVDIRRDKPVPFSQDIWDEMIEEDDVLILNLVRALRNIDVPTIYKFSPRSDDVVIRGDEVYVPPFTNYWSRETWVDYGCGGLDYLSQEEYVNRAKLIRSNGDVQLNDSSNFYAINRSNYMFTKFLSPFRAFYTLSNSLNDPAVMFRFLMSQDSKYYANLPFKPQMQYEGHGRLFADGAGHLDYSYEPNLIVHKARLAGRKVSAYTTSDFAYLLYMRGTKQTLTPSFPANLTGMHARRWFWIANDQDTHLQTRVNSQTHIVKLITRSFRMNFNLTNDSLHSIRRRVLAVFMEDPMMLTRNGIKIKSYKIVQNPRINGVVNGHPVAVAGHVVNLLLISTLEPVDMNRYFDTVESSLNGESIEEVETGENPWHSPLDLYLGVVTYVAMSKMYRFKMNAWALLVSLSRIRNIFGGKYDLLKNNPTFYSDVKLKAIFDDTMS
jgi:hypothetical protein